MSAPFLEVKDLHGWYGESHVLHGVDLEVRRGELVTLVGRNGAGKTTTMKSIMGLVGKRTGSVKVEGAETVGMEPFKVARHGIELNTVNAGGGFPVPYEGAVPTVQTFAHAIGQSMGRAFGSSQPSLMLEPGRCLVAEAGVIQTEVVLVARKSLSDATRWVYLDVGKFGGLAETLDESIQYRLHTTRTGIPGPVVLAGPTCDDADILYEKTPYELPLDLECGDRIAILTAGAYPSSYASAGFHGFPPLKTYCL